jgi:hypothetical protein
LLILTDNTNNVSSFGITLDTNLAEFDLSSGLTTVADLERMGSVGIIFCSGKAFTTTGGGVEFVEKTQVLVVLCQGEVLVPRFGISVLIY